MKALLILSTILLSTTIKAQEFFPEAILKMNNFFSHHVLVAEKSTHILYLFKNDSGQPKLLQKYQMATGKKSGDKIFQGDHRTPEGIYIFNDFLTHQQLLDRHGKAGEIYGVGAFVMNYPNPLDNYKGKTGGGIWLHSTNDETRIDKGLDSRGCIVAHNQNLIKISEYIELNKTNIIVVHDLKYLSKDAWQTQRAELVDTVNDWLDAWQKEDFERYISHYSQKEFRDPRKGSYSRYKNYKRAVFNNPGKPTIEISNITVLKSKDYATVTFKQDYTSNTIEDIGKKTLYLRKDNYYKWKIVAERWTKNGVESATENEAMAFTPSMRFFESEDPKQIFTKNLNLTQPNQKSNN